MLRLSCPLYLAVEIDLNCGIVRVGDMMAKVVSECRRTPQQLLTDNLDLDWILPVLSECREGVYLDHYVEHLACDTVALFNVEPFVRDMALKYFSVSNSAALAKCDTKQVLLTECRYDLLILSTLSLDQYA